MVKENAPKKDRYCSYCGYPHSNLIGYPKHCNNCKRDTWQNAPAIGVGLVPITTSTTSGLLMARRNIPPGKGEIALPGGYKDLGETWEAGIAREIFEETGIVVDASKITMAGVRNSHIGGVLIFGLCERLFIPDPVFVLDHETQEAMIVDHPIPTCFPSHTEMVEWFWAEAKTLYGW